LIKHGIDNAASFQTWSDLWRLVSKEAPAFFSPQYYISYQEVEQAEAECFWGYQDEQNFLFYPYLRKSVNKLGYELSQEYYDVSGAYGFNGPLGIVSDRDFLKTYNQLLQEHFRDCKVVTELVRYCPIAENCRWHDYTDQIDVLDNVYIDLSRGSHWVWHESFEYRVRKTVRKGQSYGLKTTFSRGSEIQERDLVHFYTIYTSTMSRNEADNYYFFPRSFFSSLVHNLGDMAVLALTWLKDKPISAELVLVGAKIANGFLGGTLGEYYEYKANTFQRWELVKYLCEMGVEKYSMGGGATRGDGIYKFKMSFAQGCVNPFYIGTYVYLPEVFAEIQTQWRAKYPRAAQLHSHKIQGYRIQA